ncbi:MAG: sigma-54-dependent Fis family transcriptional regulator [Acetobacteraceae bacterium]|nr:sigma-54-dependent Fis family transcriptional regulator [Acetobacteraceae bacterium]
MHVLIIGTLAGELEKAARLAIARGVRIDVADCVEVALSRLRANTRISLLLCEASQDVARLIRILSVEKINLPVVAYGIGADFAAAERATRAGAREFLPLPTAPDLIVAMLAGAVEEGPDLVVRDPAMIAAIQRAEQVAASDASVLIYGESGTGKELIARYIHRRSNRNRGPFVALNCAAIPDNLLESELFGYEKGAFSGAVTRRLGKFEAADLGTLLLDEVSEMEVRLQAKLLRAVQEKTIDRLGGSTAVRVNVRILATTNRDLAKEVGRGSFRQDLFFRLNVVSLRVPPLRERPADITALADHFSRHFAELNGLPCRTLSTAAQARLANYDWQGNVRELENTVHRAVLLAQGSEIEADVIELGPPAYGGREVHAPKREDSSLVGRRVQDVERDLILQTLVHTMGNRTQAATLLGISIRSLRNKLRDYAAQGMRIPPPVAGLSASSAV